jgi:casein kinase I family protein HRR25
MNLINHKYKLLEKIGEGSFGFIFKGKNIRSNEEVAIKIEPIATQTKLLKNESIIYQYLLNTNGIPSVKWYGKDDRNYYMVINLLGESLQTVKDSVGSFSLHATLQIGIQIITLLQTIHDKGLIHRDLKPDNFLFGLNDKKTQIYIIDFGFARTFIDNDTKVHIPMSKLSNLIGSLTYASINAHNYIELSRRDDLESLVYMLIYFVRKQNLEWQNIDIVCNNREKNTIITQQKRNMIENPNANIPFVFIKCLRMIRALEFEDDPPYLDIINILNAELKQK